MGRRGGADDRRPSPRSVRLLTREYGLTEDKGGRHRIKGPGIQKEDYAQ